MPFGGRGRTGCDRFQQEFGPRCRSNVSVKDQLARIETEMKSFIFPSYVFAYDGESVQIPWEAEVGKIIYRKATLSFRIT